MIKAVIFDLDGTLADTMDDLQTAMNAMLRDFSYPERSKEDLLKFINKGARKFVGQSLPEDVVTDCEEYSDDIVTKALKIYSAHYADCYADKTYPYEGMENELAKLKEKGIKLGVLSNKQDKFVKVIVEKLFPGVFESVNGQVEGIPEKPNPGSALSVAKALCVDFSECAFVGDSDVDVKTALNAEMHCVAVSWGYRNEECLKAAGANVVVNKVCNLADTILSL